MKGSGVVSSSQKTELFIVTAVRNSNPTFLPELPISVFLSLFFVFFQQSS
jgi:hypothetical protein